MPTIPSDKTLVELLALGYSPSDIIAGTTYTLSDFTIYQLKAAGFTAAQLNIAGFDAASIVIAYSLAELVTSGIDIAVILNNKVGFNQLGQDIDGEAIYDYSGWSVSMNSEGTRVAIGAPDNTNINGPYSGSTRVYQYNGTAWVQLGQDIDGEAADDQSGYSVSMNVAGTRVAIGALFNDGNGTDSGSTRVYEYNVSTSLWVKFGQDIDGEAANDHSGYSVSMNAAGSIVAIGALLNDGNGNNSGHTRVYEYNVSTSLWVKLGQDIDGEAAGDYSGYSVSMNSEGSRVAIGARNNDGNGNNSGHTRVYQYNGTAWVQLGQDIDGEAIYDYSGWSVSMNSEGTRVAIGALYNDGNGNNSGSTRVYEYNVSTSLWVKLGQDIDGEAANDQSGNYVSMNAAGSIVAIGARNNDGNGTDSGSTRVYEYNVSTSLWVKLGQDIDGEAANDNSGYSVSMNAAGSRVAIGAVYNTGNGNNSGSTRVYEYSRPTLRQFKDAGFTAAQLKDAGFTATELKDAGYSATELNAARFTSLQLREAGYSIAEFKLAGYTDSSIMKAGFPSKQLTAYGYTLQYLFTLRGANVHILHLYGFTVPEIMRTLRSNTVLELKNLGVNESTLFYYTKNIKDIADAFPNFKSRYNPKNLQQYYTVRQLNTVWSLGELKRYFTLLQLNTEFTLVELHSVYTFVEMKLYFTLKQLNREFTLRELAAVFTLDLLYPTFTFNDLYDEFTYRGLAEVFTLKALYPGISLTQLHNEYTLRELVAIFGWEAVKSVFSYATLITEFTEVELN
jgi:hypothetical protein